jgi:hypothetical protein
MPEALETLRTPDFYEFVAIIIPGSAFLVGIGYLFGVEKLDALLKPQTFGGLGVHLVLAYVTGHLLQGIGNGIESIYWRAWKGMPTDWPITRPGGSSFPGAKSTTLAACGISESDSRPTNLTEWRALVAQARSTVYASGRAGRLQFFNGNYGLFRGLLAAELTIGLVAWWSPISRPRVYVFLFVLALLTGYRMHRFGKHYAYELFANVRELARSHKERSADASGMSG